MKTIKVRLYNEIPRKFTGIVDWENGDKEWFKNGKWHREDGPAYIRNDGFKFWCLDGKYIWNSNKKLDLTNQIVLSKAQYPYYSLIQIWKILDKGRVYERIIIPGMEELITE